MDPEIKAMSVIGEALSAIEDDAGRHRVLRWANEKFGLQKLDTRALTSAAQSARVEAIQIASSDDNKEIPGIAMLSAGGEFRLTVRDVKAKSAIDAALRLTHIVIRAHERLTGQKSISSKNMLVPLLKTWRVYDGNARYALAKHKGIVRNGDNLELDFHAQQDADRFIADVLDATVEGSWDPSAKARRRRSSPAPMTATED